MSLLEIFSLARYSRPPNSNEHLQHMTEVHAPRINMRQVLTPDRTLYSAREDSKKRLFELISQVATKNMPQLDPLAVFEGLVCREKLGSTGIGHGVALPHTRIPHISHPIGVLIHLQEPISFDALDDQAVDLFFGLLVPKAEEQLHLQLLASLAKIFHDPNHRLALRQAGDQKALYHSFIEFSDHHLS